MVRWVLLPECPLNRLAVGYTLGRGANPAWVHPAPLTWFSGLPVVMWGSLRRLSTGGCAVFGPRTPPRLRRGVSCIAGGTGLGGVPRPLVYRGVRRLRASHSPPLARAVEGLLLCRWARSVVLGV